MSVNILNGGVSLSAHIFDNAVQPPITAVKIRRTGK